MKQTIKPRGLTDTWNPEKLFSKSLRYIQKMQECKSEEWDYALWSSLALEFLARAALANISPALLPDPKSSWETLFDALGFEPKETKYVPHSISVAEVFKRLRVILPEFRPEHERFGVEHTGKRNAELHSGEAAFDGVKGATWQPRFYETSQVLLRSMGMDLHDLFGKAEAEVAVKMITAYADDSAKSVAADIAAHKKVWEAKGDDEKDKLRLSAGAWATRQEGHRVDCPACGSTSLVRGEAISAPTRKLDEDTIIETQEYLPSQFECVACGLKISGLSRLAASGLGDRYKKTEEYYAADFYGPQDEYYQFEDDNNER